MATQYTSLLGLALPVTGELSGSWGDVVNDSITSLLDSAVSGTTTLSADADVTLTGTDGVANQARQAILLWTATGTVTRNITAPAQSKAYFVINKTGGTQSIVIRGAGPTTGVTVLAGTQALVVWDGVDFVEVASGNVDGPSSATDNAVARFDGTTGKLIQNSAVTIDDSNNVSGVVQLNATTVDATNVEVTNIKAKDGTAAVQIADTTGVVSVTAAPILTALTASQAVFTNASKALVSNAITGTGNVVMSASPTLTGTVTAAEITASGTVTGNGNWVLGNADTDTITQGASYVTGTKLRSAKAATNTLALAAYDVDGAAYTDLVTLTASNTPTLALTSTGVGTMDNISVGATTAAPGAFTTLTAGSTVTASGLTASQAVFTNASKELTSNSITGTGDVVMSNSPTLVTPALGTPSSVTLTNATGLPISTGVSGLGTGVATALAVNVGTAGAPVVNGGALGTPSSGTVTNLTGTASININGTVGATTANTGAFTNLSSTGNTTLGDASADTVTINGTVQPGVVISGSSTGSALRITQTGAGNALLVEDDTNPDSTPFVIDAAGKVIVGNTTNTTNAGGFNLQLVGTNSASAGQCSAIFSNTNLSGVHRFVKSRSATLNANSIVLADDFLGATEFYGADGANYVPAATIAALVDGTPGTNDMPGRLAFSTTSDGASTPTERVRIDSKGQTKFSYNAVVEVTDNTNAALRITQLGTGNALLVEDSTNPDSTPFVIDALGRVIQGYTTSILTADDYTGTNRTGWGYQGNVTNTAGALFTSWNTGVTAGAGISLSRSKSATIGTQAIVSSGDSLGGIGFNGDDGANFIVAASISAEVDGTPGTNDMPGRLVFSTTADGASTPTERVRISSSGLNTIGSQAGAGAALATTVPAKLYLSTGTYTDTATAASGTVTHGTIASFDNPAIAATNATVTYTNASTVYIDGAPTAGSNVTITNPYALYVAGGSVYFGGGVSAADPIVQQSDIGTAPNEVPLNQYLGGLAYVNTETPALDVGTGITTGAGTICKANGGLMGGIYQMTILIDLTGLNSGGTAGDIIGVNGTALPCYIARLPAMTVLGGRMTCLELPAGGDTDIDLYSAAEGTGVEDQAITALTETEIINGGTQALGTVTVFSAYPTLNQYLYLVGQSTSNATYTAGRFLIEIFGVQ